MKTLLLKMSLLGILVLPAQVLWGHLRHREPCSRRDTLDVHRAGGVTTVHFGDSVLKHVAASDGDRRTLPQMVQDEAAGERMGVLQVDASTMELYHACAVYLARNDRRPRRLLIPVNLRSFSLEWDVRPEYQMRVDRLRLNIGDLLALGFLTPLSHWKIYPIHPVTPEQYRRMDVVACGRRIASVGDLMEGSRTAPGLSLLESQFLLRYGYELRPDHRKLKAMEAIVETCRRSGMEPWFYVNPVDLQAAGAEVREQIARNVETIRTAMARRNGRLLDLSAALNSSCFDWKMTGLPNEHLNEQGRRRVAQALASFLASK
jgi:hypothetical protein